MQSDYAQVRSECSATTAQRSILLYDLKRDGRVPTLHRPRVANRSVAHSDLAAARRKRLVTVWCNNDYPGMGQPLVDGVAIRLHPARIDRLDGKRAIFSEKALLSRIGMTGKDIPYDLPIARAVVVQAVPIVFDTPHTLANLIGLARNAVKSVPTCGAGAVVCDCCPEQSRFYWRIERQCPSVRVRRERISLRSIETHKPLFYHSVIWSTHKCAPLRG